MMKRRVMFVYWGRRGALSQFTLELARTAVADDTIAATISVSRQNELFSNFTELGSALWPIDTFASSAGAALNAWRIPVIRRRLHDKLVADRTEVVIELMPHVWSSVLMPAARKAGARYCTIIHDADAHPGDRTSLVKGLLDRAIGEADVVCTLSKAVAGRLEAMKQPPRKIFTLAHPDLAYGPRGSRRLRAPGEPVRLLFLGRIMAYKGLGLFVETAEKLRARGASIEVGVFGEGPLGDSEPRLEALGAEVVNRWLTGEEIADALGRYDVVVLSHTEASQSGVAATAFGAGVPVVATPVGGLVEQIEDGVTGILAKRADADALVDAIERLARSPETYEAIRNNVDTSGQHRSMARFVRDIVAQSL